MIVTKRDETRIAARVAEDLKRRVEECGALIGSNESDIVRLCLEAFCTYVEQNKASPFPCVIQSQATLEKEMERLIERVVTRKYGEIPSPGPKTEYERTAELRGAAEEEEEESNYPGNRPMVD